MVEQQKADLMFIINAKLTLIDGRYHQLRQKKDRENKVDIVKIRQESGRKGGQANSKLTSSKPSDSDSISIYNSIWEKLSIKRGSKSVALRSWLKVARDIKPEILIEKYNALCSQADDPKFIPHFATWLNHERWEEELPSKKEETPFSLDNSPSRLKMFQSDKITPFLISYAQKYEQEVKQALENKDITLERAKELGINV